MRARKRAPSVRQVGKELFWIVVILLGGLWTAGCLAAAERGKAPVRPAADRPAAAAEDAR